MNSIDWRLAPEDATHALPGTTKTYFLKNDVLAYRWMNGDWSCMGSPLKDYFFASELIERHAPQNDESQNVARIEWDGEGYPPIGLFCEYKSTESGIWSGCEIVATRNNAWIVLGDGYETDFVTLEALRPRRTPEQIAADEREKARDDALNTMTGEGLTDGETEEQWQFRLKIVSEMLDMGYRKP